MLNYKQKYKPVCGSDEKTYDNLCRLEKAKCEKNPELVVQYETACLTTACSEAACGKDNYDIWYDKIMIFAITLK